MQDRIDVSELRGPLAELFDQLSGANGRPRFEEFKLWQKEVTSNLLQPETVVPVSEVRHFVAKGHLQAANVGWTGENFKRQFLDRVEEYVPAGRIATHTLLKGSLDPEIMVELGRNRRGIHLAHFFQLLEKQANGQSGSLLTSGAVNVGYVRGADFNFWSVSAHWFSFGRCWFVEAYSVGYPYEWHAGYRFLSQAA